MDTLVTAIMGVVRAVTQRGAPGPSLLTAFVIGVAGSMVATAIFADMGGNEVINLFGFATGVEILVCDQYVKNWIALQIGGNRQ